MANKNLSAAKDAKNDEFYTQLSEIQAEVSNYTDKFEGKVVFCNCDDPFESNFVKYFLMNFNRLKLKELIATGYKTSPIGGTDIGVKGEPYALRVTSTAKYLIGTQKDLDVKGAKYFLQTEGDNIMSPLMGNPAIDTDGKPIKEDVKEAQLDDNGSPILDKKGKPKYKIVKRDVFYEAGDFRSDMCVDLLKQSDIICTNPPFSLFREYVAMLMKYEKQFLILGNMNAITYKEFFPLLKENKVWAGYSFNKTMVFQVPDHYKYDEKLTAEKKDKNHYGKVPAITWFTNIDHAKRHQMLPLDLGFTYYGHEDMYPKYDNYDAINVDKVAQIPCDYEPCWYKCPHAASCKYAQTEGKEGKALCEQSCNGEMGVPISFMDKHCPEQFEILGSDNDFAKKMSEVDPDGDYEKGGPAFYLADDSHTHTHTHTHTQKTLPQALQQTCHSQDATSVTESSESQSVSSTNIAQNNSELSDSIDTCQTTQSMDTDSQSEQAKHMRGFLLQKCNGMMGVPISFFDKYCPEQFSIVGIACGNSWQNYPEILKSLRFNPNIKYGGGLGSGVIHGKGCYARILVKRRWLL